VFSYVQTKDGSACSSSQEGEIQQAQLQEQRAHGQVSSSRYNAK